MFPLGFRKKQKCCKYKWLVVLFKFSLFQIIMIAIMMLTNSIELQPSYVSPGLMRRALTMRGKLLNERWNYHHHHHQNFNQHHPCNFQVAEFEAMVESVPTVFIMSFALAVTGGKGVITEESDQNLFSPEVSFSINFFYWLFLQSKDCRCYFSSSPFWHRLPRQLWGWSNH